MAQPTQHDDVKKLAEMIKDIRFAMLTTAQRDGSLRSRPMGTQQVEFDGHLWFFAGADSAMTDEIQANQHVNVSYAAPDDNRYVSVSGSATIIHDKAKAKELWNPTLKAWFPKGLDDPNLALLRVIVNYAEYWDAPSSKMVVLASFVKSLATGKPADVGENEKLTLKTTA